MDKFHLRSLYTISNISLYTTFRFVKKKSFGRNRLRRLKTDYISEDTRLKTKTSAEMKDHFEMFIWNVLIC